MIDLTAGSPLGALTKSSASAASGPGDKRQDAAKDFEALLLSQMLRTMRESGSGWLGIGDDQSLDAAMGLAEEQFGRALVAGGGIGLSKFIAAGIRPDAPKPDAAQGKPNS